MEKQTVPQISPITGVSGDFYNEFHGVESGLWISSERAKEILERSPRRKYLERFPENKYVNVITKDNKDNVLRLDALIDELNLMVNSKLFPKERFREISKEAQKLIYGSER